MYFHFLEIYKERKTAKDSRPCSAGKSSYLFESLF